MKRRILALGLAAGLALTVRGRPLVLWNATASVPIGLYGLSAPSRLKRGDLVVVRPDPAQASVLAKGGWAPPGVPLLKPVAARSGQVVCRTGAVVTIDHRPVARAQAADARGLRLPQWSGCHRLREGEVFLLAPARGSLDGRYFGPTEARWILARARPIWTRSPEPGS
jgi:conjugative transfer signal peptidase TraF